ncbi:hypothetical protein [Streptomyces sp. NPDC047028]|uniref:hypothetical protein n=1 Tax=Streptomyces sp. NPDC047028 TaxID=3155793 RepID=UPI0033F2A946
MDAYEIETLLLECLPADASPRSEYQSHSVRRLAALLADYEERIAVLESRISGE